MNGRLFICVVVLLAVAGPAGASIIIDVGTHDLVENLPGQVVQLTVTGGDQVTAFNLRAMIGDGMGAGAEPVFESVDFTGGIWDAHDNAVTGGPIAGHEQYAQASVAFTDSVSVSANGLLVTLTIDTTGFFSGSSYPLLLSSTDFGADSDFVAIGGAVLAAGITNGTLNIIGGGPVAGDANGDGVVDADDYIILKTHMGQTTGAGAADGDFDLDGTVNWGDLQVLIGAMSSAGGQSPSVPEPGCATLLLIAAGWVLRRRRT